MTETDHKTVEREGVIFIPDISGFTKFVHDIDIKTGREITAELLSVILQTNMLNMKVSEIEGDAVLFYRYGLPPGLKYLMNQYEMMLVAFKRKLMHLNEQRNLPNIQLSLKLIVHYGLIAEFQLYGFKKLYGEAIVEAHQLLKTDVPSHNYILITDQYFDKAASHETEALILPKWITKERLTRSGKHNDVDFTCFLYDTEILKENVLHERSGEFLTNP